MKALHGIVVIGLVVLSLSTMFIGRAEASARHPDVAQASFEGSPAWQKLDLRLREAWRVSSQEKKGDRTLECLLKAAHALSAEERASLSSAGFAARTFMGTIVSGSLTARRVPDVAALPFVSAMELAVPLELKK